jgi:hypothetical protein
MKKMLSLTFAALALLSCKIQGLTNDFNKLTPEQKKLIVILDEFNTTKPDFIYKINGKQLQQELLKHPKSLVYIFKNGCTSKLCKPLMIYENYAKFSIYVSQIFFYFFAVWFTYGIAALMDYKTKNIMYNILDLFAKNFFGLYLGFVVLNSMK